MTAKKSTKAGSKAGSILWNKAGSKAGHNLVSQAGNRASKSSYESVKGISVTKGIKAKDLVNNYSTIGFQATNLSRAVSLIKEMKRQNATIIITFTSNMVSSGLRELFAQLVKEKFVDIIITGIGSVEEDIMKSYGDFLIGNFNLDDNELNKKGINRIGNILVEGKHYCNLEDFIQPLFKKLYSRKKIWNPSELIYEMGLEIKGQMKYDNSILYWASKNNIPIYCPAPTDGAIGLQAYFFKKKNKDFVIDVTGDMTELANKILSSDKVGGIILGGGFAKHHAIGVNILREGMDYAVYVSTATQYDGSLSGARPKEAVSWSKIKGQASTVNVECDATIAFPLIIAGVKG